MKMLRFRRGFTKSNLLKEPLQTICPYQTFNMDGILKHVGDACLKCEYYCGTENDFILCSCDEENR